MAGREPPVWLVAKREIREATRATAFRVTLIISAVALAAIIIVANLGNGGTDTQDVVISGPEASTTAAGIEQLGQAAGLDLRVLTVADDTAARAAVDDEQADLAVSADGATLTTRKPVDLEGDSKLATLINVLRPSLALDNGLRAAGLTPDQAATIRDAPPPDVTSVRGEDPNEIDTSRIATATITNILLFIMLQTYGQWVLQGVTARRRRAWSRCCWR